MLRTAPFIKFQDFIPENESITEVVILKEIDDYLDRSWPEAPLHRRIINVETLVKDGKWGASVCGGKTKYAENPAGTSHKRPLTDLVFTW